MNWEEMYKKARYSLLFQEIEGLKRLARKHKWKYSAVWYKIYSKYGDKIFEFEKELEMPQWFLDEKKGK